jgi:hypothetical protein
MKGRWVRALSLRALRLGAWWHPPMGAAHRTYLIPMPSTTQTSPRFTNPISLIYLYTSPASLHHMYDYIEQGKHRYQLHSSDATGPVIASVILFVKADVLKAVSP